MWQDYEATYKQFPLAKALEAEQEAVRQTEEEEKKLRQRAEELRKVIRRANGEDETGEDTVQAFNSLSEFVVALAEYKVKTWQTSENNEKMREQLAELQNTLEQKRAERLRQEESQESQGFEQTHSMCAEDTAEDGGLEMIEERCDETQQQHQNVLVHQQQKPQSMLPQPQSTLLQQQSTLPQQTKPAVSQQSQFTIPQQSQFVSQLTQSHMPQLPQQPHLQVFTRQSLQTHPNSDPQNIQSNQAPFPTLYDTQSYNPLQLRPRESQSSQAMFQQSQTCGTPSLYTPQSSRADKQSLTHPQSVAQQQQPSTVQPLHSPQYSRSQQLQTNQSQLRAAAINVMPGLRTPQRKSPPKLVMPTRPSSILDRGQQQGPNNTLLRQVQNQQLQKKVETARQPALGSQHQSNWMEHQQPPSLGREGIGSPLVHDPGSYNNTFMLQTPARPKQQLIQPESSTESSPHPIMQSEAGPLTPGTPHSDTNMSDIPLDPDSPFNLEGHLKKIHLMSNKSPTGPTFNQRPMFKPSTQREGAVEMMSFVHVSTTSPTFPTGTAGTMSTGQNRGPSPDARGHLPNQTNNRQQNLNPKPREEPMFKMPSTPISEAKKSPTYLRPSTSKVSKHMGQGDGQPAFQQTYGGPQAPLVNRCGSGEDKGKQTGSEPNPSSQPNFLTSDGDSSDAFDVFCSGAGGAGAGNPSASPKFCFGDTESNGDSALALFGCSEADLQGGDKSGAASPFGFFKDNNSDPNSPFNFGGMGDGSLPLLMFGEKDDGETEDFGLGSNTQDDNSYLSIFGN
ncbi:mediator of RNA polymerase II transcription subunit 15-like [Lingula anatina]|uniref:Mediator of RNA polymerase II transcription subunit 15-like n=1 Tax=Lingula anatina TaxID=7574 RepID=A0A1S3K0W0_LINAN|nr:mediator of RNA polymerase II transcription subunit 15-like [Lingula anatina]|eukprot:XP_013416167.1 mediator of RNA polymerase II transcription subunit 15-like [Lingula anatina]